MIELPPGHAAIFPSSLLSHFNLDLHPTLDKDGNEVVDETNTRRTVVFYSQGTVLQTSINRCMQKDLVGANAHKKVLDWKLAFDSSIQEPRNDKGKPLEERKPK